MTPDETNALREIVETMTARIINAERRVAVAERQRDELRALLTRLRTSLAESTTLQDDDGRAP